MVLFFISACGLHPQGEMALAAPLHKMYLSSTRPYGDLTRYLTSYLKLSSVKLMPSQAEADTVLVISQDETSQELTGISNTQQTRQYQLHAIVTFAVTDKNGRSLIPSQTLTETRAITVQSNQILGSSNEANLYFQQMRRSLAYALMNRLSSRFATENINNAFKIKTPKASST
jgi:outer membrane lipopolysaccharide assembly protein LptE/RlpB